MSEDLKDYLLPWYDYIVSHGIWSSLGDEFSNYMPPYLYLLGIITLTKGYLSAVTAIKLISIFFDLVNACLVGIITRTYTHDDNKALLAGSLFFVLPTIMLNSAAWSQADSIYSCFILISFVFLLKELPLPALFCFGVAIAFKAQAIFFTPFLLLLTFQKRIPWYAYFLVPVASLIMIMPSLLAGRAFSSVALVYLGQAETYQFLSRNAPNPYIFINNDFYRPVLLIGISIALLLIFAWVVGTNHMIRRMDLATMLVCATVSVSLTPFLLPKMHERYFYLMDVFTFLLACCIPNLRLPAFLAQVSSVLTYSIFLFSSTALGIPNWKLLFMLAAVSINIVLIVYLLWKQYSILKQIRPAITQTKAARL